MSAAQNQALAAVVEPVVAAAGAYLEGATVTPTGRRRVVRVVVDEVGGLTLDRVATISRAVSDALDSSDVLGESPYVLEVSSPGVSRPLTLARHWAGAAGRLVAVKLSDGSELTGRVLESSERDATLDVAGQPVVVVTFETVSRAVVQVEMTRVGEVEFADDEAEPQAQPETAGIPAVDSDQE